MFSVYAFYRDIYIKINTFRDNRSENNKILGLFIYISLLLVTSKVKFGKKKKKKKKIR